MKVTIATIIFILIAVHAPISARPSYFEATNHKITNHLPRPIHKAYILSSIWLGISLKMAKIIHFGLIFATNIETNKRPPKMIYLSTPGAYWNEYGDQVTFDDTMHLIGFVSSYEVNFGLAFVSICKDMIIQRLSGNFTDNFLLSFAFLFHYRNLMQNK